MKVANDVAQKFGRRIAILGLSNAGKSTLAVALSRKLDIEAIHLDQLYHYPSTDWQARPHAEFLALHDQAIAADEWIIEGNYSSTLPPRLARATHVIFLHLSVPVALYRYIRRSLFEPNRQGGLGLVRERINSNMVRHITLVAPHNMRRYQQLVTDMPNAPPATHLSGQKEIDRFYAQYQLEIPDK